MKTAARILRDYAPGEVCTIAVRRFGLNGPALVRRGALEVKAIERVGSTRVDANGRESVTMVTLDEYVIPGGSDEG